MSFDSPAKRITPCGPVSGTVRPPGSKSLTNRAILCAAFADGVSELRGALDSEDTRVMIEALRQLGIAARWEGADRLLIEGCGGDVPNRRAQIFVANSGTTMRFLAAVLSAVGGDYYLDGVPRMRQRPMGDLLDALQLLGVQAVGQVDPRFPPIRITSQGWQGGSIRIKAKESSQFLSGLLLAAPLSRSDVEIAVEGPIVSRPYVDMTLRVMEAFGIVARRVPDDPVAYHIRAPQAYRSCCYTIEPDATAASYFWAAAAITGGTVRVEGLSYSSVQGDVAFCRCLEQMGCTILATVDSITVQGGALHGIDVDMNPISDTVMTLAAVALFADGPTRIRNVAHIRHKETDRIGDLARELRRLGVAVEECDDGLTIHPGKLSAARIRTYQDHRMAMSFSLVGLRQPGIEIEDPKCVEKTYPHFFEDLEKLTAPSDA